MIHCFAWEEGKELNEDENYSGGWSSEGECWLGCVSSVSSLQNSNQGKQNPTPRMECRVGGEEGIVSSLSLRSPLSWVWIITLVITESNNHVRLLARPQLWNHGKENSFHPTGHPPLCSAKVFSSSYCSLLSDELALGFTDQILFLLCYQTELRTQLRIFIVR